MIISAETTRNHKIVIYCFLSYVIDKRIFSDIKRQIKKIKTNVCSYKMSHTISVDLLSSKETIADHLRKYNQRISLLLAYLIKYVLY